MSAEQVTHETELEWLERRLMAALEREAVLETRWSCGLEKIHVWKQAELERKTLQAQWMRLRGVAVDRAALLREYRASLPAEHDADTLSSTIHTDITRKAKVAV